MAHPCPLQGNMLLEQPLLDLLFDQVPRFPEFDELLYLRAFAPRRVLERPVSEGNGPVKHTGQAETLLYVSSARKRL